MRAPARCMICQGQLGSKWIATILGAVWCLGCNAAIEEQTTASEEEAVQGKHRVR